MRVRLSTLCYIEKENQYLMLYRVVKKNDVNKDKWIGVGGHFEEGESPEECLQAIRENTMKHCIYEEEFCKVGKALGLEQFE